MVGKAATSTATAIVVVIDAVFLVSIFSMRQPFLTALD
jgi:hypothetical protein